MRAKRFSALFLAIGLVLALAVGCATTKSTGETAEAAPQAEWKFHDIVDVDFVQQHVTIPVAENVMIIDARPKRAKYDKGHIPGAVSIPDSKFEKMTAQLPASKDALLIFYCGGPT